jgi:hypothetical protein
MLMATRESRNRLVNSLASRSNRLARHIDASNRARGGLSMLCTSAEDSQTVTIGGVSRNIKPPSCPELVPRGYHDPSVLSQETLGHLRWILQKDNLSQDVFLVGPPGPLRRWLALQYCELTQRETEVLTITRDTTEADLKQRREIVGGTSVFVDQGPVRAAMEGRVLILDGLEKVRAVNVRERCAAAL